MFARALNLRHEAEGLVAGATRLRRLSLAIATCLVAALALNGPACHAEEAPREIEGATTLGSEGVVDLILKTAGIVIIDARRKADFDDGHIEGAINIPDTELTSEAVLAQAVTSKSTPVLFYCNGFKCGRAAHATTIAIQWNYSNVFYFAAGMEEWKANRLPLVTSSAH